MNKIDNDKSLTLPVRQKEPQQKTVSIPASGVEAAMQTVGLAPAIQGNPNLSATGQFLNQSTINEPEPSRSVLESTEQASALLSKLLQQFEQSGVDALKAHKSVRYDQMELLLRSTLA